MFPRFALRRGAFIGLFASLMLVLAACGGGAAEEDPGDSMAGGTVSVTDGTVEISAADLEFDANVIQAPAGEAFTITFVNNDSAPHNISIKTDEGGEFIVQGEIINEGETTTVEVPALEAGEYYFLCDVHPDMNGAVVVEG